MFRGSQWLGCVLWLQDWCVELWSDAVQLHHRRISIRGWNHLQTFREHWQVWGKNLTNHSIITVLSVSDQSQLSINSIWPITAQYYQYLTNHSSVWIVTDQSQLGIISIWPITTLYCQVSVPAYVDKVLESLLRLMLSKEPDQRPDIATLKHHDWCRKRFPR